MIRSNIKDMSIVLTGASSGIGRALAISLAKEGANLVLAARREGTLQDLAIECETYGTKAKVVKTDVTNYEEVKNLSETAKALNGKIDVWINNAGVGAMGYFDETPIEIHERVIKTNLVGYMYGAHAVIPHFKSLGTGILINTISVGAYVPNPYAVAYSASKFGLRGFTDALRYELSNFPDIYVCDVNPSFIDTPGFEHAANYTGKELKPAPPLYDPFQVASAIISMIKNPRPHVMVGGSARIARLFHFLFPEMMGKTMAKIMRSSFEKGKEVKKTAGALFAPTSEGKTIRGGWMKRPSALKKYFQKKYSH